MYTIYASALGKGKVIWWLTIQPGWVVTPITRPCLLRCYEVYAFRGGLEPFDTGWQTLRYRPLAHSSSSVTNPSPTNGYVSYEYIISSYPKLTGKDCLPKWVCLCFVVVGIFSVPIEWTHNCRVRTPYSKWVYPHEINPCIESRKLTVSGRLHLRFVIVYI